MVLPTLLSRLKAPTASNVAQKGVISMNPAKKSKATVQDEPKISPTVQIKEFPNELTVSNSKLFCSACTEPLSVKKSVVQESRSSFG